MKFLRYGISKLFKPKAVIVLLCACIILPLSFFSCRKKTFTVTFDYGYDEKVETVVVEDGKVSAPLDATRTGHSFDGWWNYEGAYPHAWDFDNDTVKSDITLVAKWSRIFTTVILDANGGVCEKESVELNLDEKYKLPIPTREGYIFDGWKWGSNDITEGVWVRSDLRSTTAKARWITYESGMKVTIGRFEQDNDPSNGAEDIEWYVIDYRDGKYYLISEYILTGIKKEKGKDIKWAGCEVRSWLNGEFYNSAFTESEKSFILDTYLENEGTTDKVFIISTVDKENFVYDEVLDRGAPTQYARAQGVVINSFSITPPCETSCFYIRGSKGNVYTERSDNIGGVRPAMWISEEYLEQLKKDSK